MEGEAKFCSKCGHPIRPVQMFCVGCGTRLQGQNSDMEAGFHANSSNPMQGSQMPTINGSSNQSAPSPASSVTSSMPVIDNQSVVNEKPISNNPVKSTENAIPKTAPAVQTKTANSNIPKKVLVISLAVLMVISLIGLSILFVINAQPKSRVSMIYMIGSDLESQAGLASKDIEEIKRNNISSEANHKVLVYTGGSSAWESSDVNPNENAVYELVGNNLKKVKVFERSVMTDAKALTDYLNYVSENYKATNYDLVLWDHGGGPIFGFGLDENSSTGAAMSISTLAQAISSSTISHLEMIGFDANLMANLEVAKALAPVADYLLASEGTEPDDGWDYSYLSDLSSNETPKEFGNKIIEAYFKQYEYYQYNEDLSLSLIDLKKVDATISSLDVVADKISTYLSSDNFSQYMRELKQSRVFGFDGKRDSSFDLVDLSTLFTGLNEKYGTEVAGVVSSTNDTIVARRSNISDTNGLSIYFPTYNRRNLAKVLKDYSPVKASDKYYNLLDKILSYVNGDQLVSRNNYPDLTASHQLNTLEDNTVEHEIVLELNDELANSYESSELIVYKKNGENSYISVYKSSDFKLDGKLLSTTDTDSKIVLKVHRKDTDTYKSLTPFVSEVYRCDDYVDYVLTGLYYPNLNSLLGEPRDLNLYVRFDKGSSSAKLIDSVGGRYSNGLSSRMTLSMTNAGRLEFPNYSLELFDDLGNRLLSPLAIDEPNTIIIDQLEGDTFSVEKESLETIDGKDDYYYELDVYDTQGYIHRLNLLQIERKDNDAM